MLLTLPPEPAKVFGFDVSSWSHLRGDSVVESLKERGKSGESPALCRNGQGRNV
jgi:hypothetical protein